MADTMPLGLRRLLFALGILAFMAALSAMAVLKPFHGLVSYAAIFIWAVGFLAFTYFGSTRISDCQPMGKASIRYRRRLAMAMLTYFVVLMGSIGLLNAGDLTGPLLWVVAAAPAAPILWVLAIMGLYLKEEGDELERAIHVEAMLWGLASVLGVSTVWGFLSNAEVVPAPPLFMTFPLFCAAWGMSQGFIRRRYR
ncbi:hypothetical protein [Caulobacter sp. RHG1]|uniref:hypothetical protein n=1 Tax=Caulobacter sp. (strain RHG1) TaxID=2545762 RepID=UPI001556B23D|nr:hypothetical protein [Caulobacter sp. RHG1]NQE62891.1 hypothetical protein [Caulobacter sp. RHG1]